MATLIDGLSPRRERQKILGHLDNCPCCFEVFIESHRFVRGRRRVRTAGLTAPAGLVLPP